MIKLNAKGGIWCSNYPNVFTAIIRGISSIEILKWIIVIWIIQIMWLICLNLAFKIANLAIFFIVVTFATIVVTIIVSKILLSSRQCRDKPNYSPHTPQFHVCLLLTSDVLLFLQNLHILSLEFVTRSKQIPLQMFSNHFSFIAH